MKSAAWFVGGMAFSAVGLSLADVGDHIYQTPFVSAEITEAKADAIRTCVVNEAVWDGVNSDLLYFELIERGAPGSETYTVRYSGLKTVAPADVETLRLTMPDGEVNIKGTVE